jgi:16S rRNA (cytosine967-C5)-methyltransferase
MPVSPARAAAFDILLRVETTDAYASELLHSTRAAALSPADHGLATEIVMGVLRWRSVLDEQIAAHITQPLTKLDAEVIAALRIGAYQLRFLDRIPAHAAINESVELVKKAKKRSASGMVNAVLRKINESSTDKAADVAQDAMALSAHPAWLVKSWKESYGAAVAQEICAYDQHAPSPAIRADPALAAELQQDGIQFEVGKLLTGARIVTGGDITRTKAFRERRLVIQDEGSQLVALLIGHGDRILDCCAAPGGKTRIIAEQNPHATIVAMELHPHRAELMKRLVTLQNVLVVTADARKMPFAGQFNRIVVDAPCTGTGTLARNPEIKWRLKAEDMVRLQQYQIEILSTAMQRVSVGGRILYSTCSLELEENESVIEHVLRGTSGFRVLNIRDSLSELRENGMLAWHDIDSLVREPYLRTIPGVHPCDGFFAALLEREM